MDYQTYSREAHEFCLPRANSWEYAKFGLYSEVGELAGLCKKMMRGDYDEATFRDMAISELGDILWYINELLLHAGTSWAALHKLSEIDGINFYDAVEEMIREMRTAAKYSTLAWGSSMNQLVSMWVFACNHLGVSPETVMKANIVKLTDRRNRGVIKGDGDNR